VGGKFNCELPHVLAEQCHPSSSVRLLEAASGGQGCAPIEDPDVVKTEEATLEYVFSVRVLSIHPPSEVQQKLFKRAFEKIDVSLVAQGLRGSMQKQGRPGVDWRVNIAEVPLIGRNLAAGVHVKPFEHEVDLLLGELRVYDRYRDGVKGQVPSRIPGIFPLVRHRDDVVVEHMEPLLVPGVPAPGVKGLARRSFNH